MKAHYLQHVPFEGPGSIGLWFESKKIPLTSTRLFQNESLPDHDTVDFLVIMGGPMSVNDEDLYPWLKEEKDFIRTFVDSGKPVLGICLGAQLIAAAMGCKVYQNNHKEIGWFPVMGSTHKDNSLFSFPESTTVFHWHGETFDLPENATLLASSKGCLNQAFQIGTSVIALQFHLETTPESAVEIITHCRDELNRARYVQSEEEIISTGHAHYTNINHLMGEILSVLIPQLML